MGALVVLATVVVATVALGHWSTTAAQRTSVLETTLSSQEVAAIIDASCRGALWRRVGGAGDINCRARSLRAGKGPTLSVDVTPHDGRTLVEMWMSAWCGRAGLAELALVVVIKKHAIARRLLRMPSTIVPLTSPQRPSRH